MQLTPNYRSSYGPASTQENFLHGQNSVPKILFLKVENFHRQHFFPTENLCQPIYRILQNFLRKILRRKKIL